MAILETAKRDRVCSAAACRPSRLVFLYLYIRHLIRPISDRAYSGVGGFSWASTIAFHPVVTTFKAFLFLHIAARYSDAAFLSDNTRRIQWVMNWGACSKGLKMHGIPDGGGYLDLRYQSMPRIAIVLIHHQHTTIIVPCSNCLRGSQNSPLLRMEQRIDDDKEMVCSRYPRYDPCKLGVDLL